MGLINPRSAVRARHWEFLFLVKLFFAPFFMSLWVPLSLLWTDKPPFFCSAFFFWLVQRYGLSERAFTTAAPCPPQHTRTEDPQGANKPACPCSPCLLSRLVFSRRGQSRGKPGPRARNHPGKASQEGIMSKINLGFSAPPQGEVYLRGRLAEPDR